MSKGLEAFDDLTCNYPKDYVKSYNIVLNYVKALEIIKKFVRVSNKGMYFRHYNLSGHITKEEYDLLKEVL